MHADHQAQAVFHLTGKRPPEGLEPVEGLALRPALFARYRDLHALRYDYPLVLAPGGPDESFVESLSVLIDRALDECAPRGTGHERLRKHVLRLERELRSLLAEGARGTLGELWNQAAARLGAGSDELLEDSVSRAAAALKLDGELVDCNAEMPVRLLTHAWQRAHERTASRFRTYVGGLALRLSDILRADYVRSRAGQSAESLRAAVGTVHDETFDFDAMSRVLSNAAPHDSLPESQRRRIEWVLSVLDDQRFYALSPRAQSLRTHDEPPYAFVFTNCAAALQAFRERLPKMVELAKAIAIAELEIGGHYQEAKHDPFFEDFSESALSADDLALFPDYLVCLRAEEMPPSEYAEVMALLSAGMPMKVVVQTDDILQESLVADSRFPVGMRSTRLASMATGLNDVYVLQSSGACLLRLRDRIRKGFACPGAALFSIFSGATPSIGHLPPYLVAAAAMESRAFPSFTYDPSAGPGWALRFSLDENPQAHIDWPLHRFGYEAQAHQQVTEELAFTFVDFAVCDPRYARHLARVPKEKWNEDLVPVAESLAHNAHAVPDEVPYVLMVDEEDRLHRVIVDDKLILEARRCAKMWHGLRELGDIREADSARAPVAAPEEPAPPAAQAPAEAAAAAPDETVPEPASDAPYIETPRCTSCDECTRLNSRMFAYDGNKQAYIADPDAGSYRQLVEAAESCQVSIIHPGKPRNPAEAGLDELLRRAQPFL